MIPMIALFSPLASAEGACPDDPVADLRDAEVALELAYSHVDDAAFDAASFKLDAALPCVAVPLSVSDVEALHRAKGLQLFVLGDSERSRAAWGAVRALLPDAKPPAGLMPMGHPMLQLWNQSADLAGPTRTLEPTPLGGWTVDGTMSAEVPVLRAYVLQGVDATGNIVYTGWYAGYESAPDLPGVEMRGKAPNPRRARMRVIGTASAGGLVLGAGALAYVASSSARDLEGASNEEVPGLIRQNHTAGGAAIGLSAASATIATVAWVVKW